MRKTQKFSVEGLAPEGREGRLPLLRKSRHLRLEGGPIDGIAKERMPQMGEVNADLMGASGLQPAADQAGLTVSFQHCVVGNRIAPDLFGYHGDLLAIMPRPGEACPDRAGGRVRFAPGEGEIGAFEGARAAVVGELSREAVMRTVVLRHDDQAAGVLVESVDDAGAAHAADAGQAGTAMGDEGIDEGAAGMAWGRMDHQPRRLVDDDEVVILVSDGEGDILRSRYGIRRGRQVEGKAGTGRDLAGWISDDAPVSTDMALPDQILQPGARQLREEADEGTIQALTALLHHSDEILTALFHPPSPIRCIICDEALAPPLRRRYSNAAPPESSHRLAV